MLTDIKIGQFFPANSLLHKLDARLKIVSLFILIVGIFVFDSQLDYIIWCMLIGTLMYMSKIPLKMFFISIKPIIWIILFTFILHLFTTQGKVIFEMPRWIDYATAFRYNLYTNRKQAIDFTYNSWRCAK